MVILGKVNVGGVELVAVTVFGAVGVVEFGESVLVVLVEEAI